MKPLYIIACCLFLAAIALDITAKRHFSAATRALAKSAGRGQLEKAQAWDKADAAVQVGSRFGFAGLVAAGLGLGSWFASFAKGKRQGKRLTPVIPLSLLIMYVMLVPVMV